MNRLGALVVLGGVVIVAGVFAAMYLRRGPEPVPKVVTSSERVPICPWRNPERDLQRLFPEATSHVAETRIVSGMMADLTRQLGRPLDPDENPLRIYRARNENGPAGSIVVRRVKGEHGGIELVTGVETNGAVRGVLIQSHREPQSVAGVITNTAWLNGFKGKTAQARLEVGDDVPAVPPQALMSARSIAQGVRSQLIVLRAAELPLEAREMGAHTQH